VNGSCGQLPAFEHTFVLVNTLGRYRAGGNHLAPPENHKTVLFNIAKAIYVYCSIEKDGFYMECGFGRSLPSQGWRVGYFESSYLRAAFAVFKTELIRQKIQPQQTLPNQAKRTVSCLS
jgi:hypothetical protein